MPKHPPQCSEAPSNWASLTPGVHITVMLPLHKGENVTHHETWLRKNPIPSMGLVYLPTFWLVFSGSNMVNVGKYTKTWMLWV